MCGGPFDAKEAEELDKLRRAQRTAKGLPPPKPFECKLCDESFARQVSFLYETMTVPSVRVRVS